jgi:hypothetical protein
MLIAEGHITVIYIGLLLSFLGVVFDSFIEKKLVNIAFIKIFVGFCLLFILYSISAIIHFQDLESFRKVVNNRFVWFSFSLCVLFTVRKNDFWENSILIVFVLFLAVISAVGLYRFNVYLHSNTVAIDYSTSYINSVFIPFKIQHHSLSIALVVGTVIIFYLFKTISNNFIRVFLIKFAVFFFIMIHLLGSRIGIISLYFFYLSFAFSYFHAHPKKWLFYGISTALAFCSLLLIGFLFPTFYTRIQETITEITYMFHTDEIKWVGNITSRLVSYKNCFPLIKEHFWIGCGEVQYKDIVMNLYDQLHIYNELERIYPPNQWYTNSITYGFPMTVFLLIIWFYFLWVEKNYQNVYFTGIWVALFLLMLTENPLNHNMSHKMYALFLPLAFRIKFLVTKQ